MRVAAVCVMLNYLGILLRYCCYCDNHGLDAIVVRSRSLGRRSLGNKCSTFHLRLQQRNSDPHTCGNGPPYSHLIDTCNNYT